VKLGLRLLAGTGHRLDASERTLEPVFPGYTFLRRRDSIGVAVLPAVSFLHRFNLFKLLTFRLSQDIRRECVPTLPRIR